MVSAPCPWPRGSKEQVTRAFLRPVNAALYNRQRAVAFNFVHMEAVCRRAAEECLSYEGPGAAMLKNLDAVEISIVSDRMIARVHRQFLQMPGPTDVITFEHGEILVSASTAATRASLEGEATDREIARYIVHGMLHLNGHLDKDAADGAAMWQAQEEVLRSLWPSERSSA